ncbi:SET domain [Trinorchestia longiramus]|nr:SET domain [Trinorchestia longiramus]
MTVVCKQYGKNHWSGRCVEEHSGMSYLLELDDKCNMIVVDAIRNFLLYAWNKLAAAVSANQSQLKKFTDASSFEEQVHVLLETLSHKPGVTIREAVYEIVRELSRLGDENEGKSEVLAQESKLEGSKAFSQHLDEQALTLYNEALRLCPSCSPNLPLLYANRSAVLFHMGRFEECLEDIDRALKKQYPDHLQHKVLVRRAQCLQSLGRRSEALTAAGEARTLCESLAPAKSRDSYFSTLEALEGLDVTLRDSKTKSSDVIGRTSDMSAESLVCSGEKLASLSDLHKEMTSAVQDFNVQAKKYKLLDGPNPDINFMSDALVMRENASEGRHVVSKRTIPAGSTLFVERPFAYMLLPKHLSSYCYNCITSLTTVPIPCLNCRIVVFCTEACRDAAQSWHRLDCCRLTLTSAGGMAQLALRAVAVAGWRVCSVVMKEGHEAVAKEQYNKYTPIARYRALYRLVHHIDQTPVEEKIQYCLASIILATALQNKLESLNRGGANKQHKQNRSNNKQLPEGWGSLEQVAALLYRHIGQLVCNGYAIYQVLSQPLPRVGKEPRESEISCAIESLSQERIASAIFATASLMNHSCKPSTINSYVGNLLVIRNVEELAPGDQVYSCYGPYYCRHSRSERRSLLQQQYHFTCTCLPCTDPTYLRAEKQWCGMKCEPCGGLATYGDPDSSTAIAGDSEAGDEPLICLDCGNKCFPSTRFREMCTKAQKLHSEGMANLEKECDVEKAVRHLQEAVRLGAQVYGEDNEFLGSLRDSYAWALSVQGSYEDSARVLKQHLGTVERRYGNSSVELGHELVKYHSILRQKCIKIIGNTSAGEKLSLREMYAVESRYSSIFTKVYGEDWEALINVQI